MSGRLDKRRKGAPERWTQEVRERWQSLAEKYDLEIVFNNNTQIDLHAQYVIPNEHLDPISLRLDGDALFIWMNGFTSEVFPFGEALECHIEMLEGLLSGCARIVRTPSLKNPEKSLKLELQLRSEGGWETRSISRSGFSWLWTRPGQPIFAFQRQR